MERTQQPAPPPSPATVINLDSYGSTWGTSTIRETDALITDERARGTAIDEWNTTDRDGCLLRIVRLADPEFLDTICVIPGEAPAAVPA